MLCLKYRAPSLAFFAIAIQSPGRQSLWWWCCRGYRPRRCAGHTSTDSLVSPNRGTWDWKPFHQAMCFFRSKAGNHEAGVRMSHLNLISFLQVKWKQKKKKTKTKKAGQQIFKKRKWMKSMVWVFRTAMSLPADPNSQTVSHQMERFCPNFSLSIWCHHNITLYHCTNEYTQDIKDYDKGFRERLLSNSKCRSDAKRVLGHNVVPGQAICGIGMRTMCLFSVGVLIGEDSIALERGKRVRRVPRSERVLSCIAHVANCHRVLVSNRCKAILLLFFAF